MVLCFCLWALVGTNRSVKLGSCSGRICRCWGWSCCGNGAVGCGTHGLIVRGAFHQAAVSDPASLSVGMPVRFPARPCILGRSPFCSSCCVRAACHSPTLRSPALWVPRRWLVGLTEAVYVRRLSLIIFTSSQLLPRRGALVTVLLTGEVPPSCPRSPLSG